MENMETMETLQEGTIPTESQPSETAETEQDAGAPQPAEGNAEQSEGVAINTDNGTDDEFISVVCNHQEKILNRDEAIKYAQLGLQKEYLDPFIAKIDYLAAINGITREQYIEQQLQNHEDAMRKEIADQYGNNENIINEMLEFKKQKHKQLYDDMIDKQKQAEKAAEDSTETRLAEEFAGLKTEFPELEGKEFKDLPKAVKQAGFNGEKLMNAYLQHKHKEAKSIAAAKAQAEEAAKKSTGSMHTEGEAQSSVIDAMLKGVRA